MAENIGVSYEHIANRVDQLHESNPMLGHRGCRLAITYPEILDMQVRAIIEAAVECRRRNIKVAPDPDFDVALAKAAPNIMGIKEASGDMAEGALLLRDRPAGFRVFSGDDPTALPLMALGAEGVISVVANAYPKTFSRMTALAQAGNYPKARRENDLLLDLHPLLYCDGNPSGVKAVMARLGLCGEHVRLPLAGVTDATREAIAEEVLRIETALRPAWA